DEPVARSVNESPAASNLPAGAQQIASPNPNGPVYTLAGNPGVNPSFQVTPTGQYVFDPNSGSGDQQGIGDSLQAAIANAYEIDPASSFAAATTSAPSTNVNGGQATTSASPT